MTTESIQQHDENSGSEMHVHIHVLHVHVHVKHVSEVHAYYTCKCK